MSGLAIIFSGMFPNANIGLFWLGAITILISFEMFGRFKQHASEIKRVRAIEEGEEVRERAGKYSNPKHADKVNEIMEIEEEEEAKERARQRAKRTRIITIDP